MQNRLINSSYLFKLQVYRHTIFILDYNIFKNKNVQVLTFFSFLGFLKKSFSYQYNMFFFYPKDIFTISSLPILYLNGINLSIPILTLLSNCLKELFIFLNNSFIGTSTSVEIVGYIRRAWISTSYIYLLLGYSYPLYYIIPNFIFFTLVKKRILFLYSNNVKYLNNYLRHFIKLKPTEAYKKTGIILYKSSVKLKKKKFNLIKQMYLSLRVKERIRYRLVRKKKNKKKILFPTQSIFNDLLYNNLIKLLVNKGFLLNIELTILKGFKYLKLYLFKSQNKIKYKLTLQVRKKLKQTKNKKILISRQDYLLKRMKGLIFEKKSMLFFLTTYYYINFLDIKKALFISFNSIDNKNRSPLHQIIQIQHNSLINIKNNVIMSFKSMVTCDYLITKNFTLPNSAIIKLIIFTNLIRKVKLVYSNPFCTKYYSIKLFIQKWLSVQLYANYKIRKYLKIYPTSFIRSIQKHRKETKKLFINNQLTKTNSKNISSTAISKRSYNKIELSTKSYFFCYFINNFINKNIFTRPFYKIKLKFMYDYYFVLHESKILKNIDFFFRNKPVLLITKIITEYNIKSLLVRNILELLPFYGIDRIRRGRNYFDVPYILKEIRQQLRYLFCWFKLSILKLSSKKSTRFKKKKICKLLGQSSLLNDYETVIIREFIRIIKKKSFIYDYANDLQEKIEKNKMFKHFRWWGI